MMQEPRQEIPYARPLLNQEDIAAVNDVLKGPIITRGERTAALEQALCDKLGCRHAVTVNSGSSALMLAYQVLGVSKGSRVWMTPLSFISTAGTALKLGAEIDFVDVDDNYNLDVTAIEDKIRYQGTPDVICAVSFAGNPINARALYLLAKRYHFRILLDQSHALGASYATANEVDHVGSCKYADIEILSFQAVKHITGGEGGAILTNIGSMAEKCRLLRNNGIVRQDERTWRYQVNELGWNLNLTDIQAALIHSQLNRLESIVEERRNLARRYDSLLSNLQSDRKLELPPGNRDEHAFHLYPLKINNRDDMYHYLRQEGIMVQVHYIPLYHHVVIKRRGTYLAGEFMNVESYYRKALSIPMYNGLTESQQEYVVQVIHRYIR